ncbi:MAG: hypothetical protein KDK70_19595 [Myxococcales bacterium]|nr:hypothetical protein [Myxococcales bacterium]
MPSPRTSLRTSPRTTPLLLALVLPACALEARCGLRRCDPTLPIVEATGTTTDADTTAGDDDGTGGKTPDAPPPRPIPRSFVAKIVAGERCPAAPAGWALQPSPTVPSTRLGELLSRYCAYRFQGGPELSPTSAPALVPARVVERLDPDYPVVLPQGDPQFVRGTAPARYAMLRQQLGIGFVDGAHPVNRGPSVAIVDTIDRTSAGAWTNDPAEQHGLTMAGIVRAIRCPETDASCSPRIIHAQAFPESLGNRGSVWSLNLAVLEAIEQWRGLASSSPLVLNMSVGWEWSSDDTKHLGDHRADLLQGLEGPADPEISVAEEALFLTLSWASCQRVLAIAAAGNTRGGACSQSGPMAPAAWEALPPLSFDQCHALLDPGDRAGLGEEAEYEQDHRLVYAAGGVDASLAPIVNARPLSTPKRVLYASMASVPVGNGQYSPPLTGTSVASASLSGIAAEYWALHPTLSAPDVIEAITDTCASNDTVDAGCAGPDDAVPVIRASTVLPQRSAPSFTLVPPALTSGSTQSSSPTQLLPPQPAGSFGPRTCTASSFAGAPSASAASWPELAPQPQNPICPTCPLNYTADPGATLGIDVDADYRSRVDPSTAVLELFLPSGAVTQVDLDLTAQPACVASPGACTVELSSYPDPTGNAQTLSNYIVQASVRKATLAFYVTTDDTTRLVGNEIDVLHP